MKNISFAYYFRNSFVGTSFVCLKLLGYYIEKDTSFNKFGIRCQGQLPDQLSPIVMQPPLGLRCRDIKKEFQLNSVSIPSHSGLNGGGTFI